MSDRLRPLSGSQAILLVVLLVGLVAAFIRIPWLAGSPPGFSLAETDTVLHARNLVPTDLVRPTTGQEPFFSGILYLTGSLTNWSIAGTRLAAALLGIITAIACALWYRHLFGPLAGIVGGLLVATTFPWLVLSRQAQPAIGAAALSALGLACLWAAFSPPDPANQPTPDRRGWWLITAGLLFGIGLSAHPSFLPGLVVVPLSVIILKGQSSTRSNERVTRGWLVAGLIGLLITATPVIVNGIVNPGNLQQRIEQDWNNDGQIERIAGPVDAIHGYAKTLLALAWQGSDNPTLGTPGRAMLDPVLILLSLIGLTVIFRRPDDPLHQLTLLWLVGFSAPAAVLDPGNPALLMPLTPILFLVPILGLHACLTPSTNCNRRLTHITTGLAIAAIIVSVGLSLLAYHQWTNADRTYLAFNGDLVDALAEVDRIAPGSTPVYIATTPLTKPLIDFLAPTNPNRFQRTIDSRTTLVIPASGIGYLVTTNANPLPANLTNLLSGQPAAATGTTPNGAPAWQILVAGQPARDQLPWTLPAFRFPDGFVLAGFAIQPDVGDVAQTGHLPDPPRMLVTIVWDAPRGATPHLSRVHLFPDHPASPASPTQAEASLTTSAPITAGNRGRELIVIQLSVPVPDTPDLVVDVQISLHRSDGSILPPIDASTSAAGDNLRLNRIQYVRDSTTTP